MRKYTKKGTVANMPKNKTTRTSMTLPADLWDATRVEAIKRNVNAQDVVAKALAAYLPREVTVIYEEVPPAKPVYVHVVERPVKVRPHGKGGAK